MNLVELIEHHGFPISREQAQAIAASVETAIRGDIAAAIWVDEQKASKAIGNANALDAAVIHMNGRALGLQRARDIAEGVQI